MKLLQQRERKNWREAWDGSYWLPATSYWLLHRARHRKERRMPEVVTAKPRTGKFNKNAARRVRVAGKIPAVLYGAGHDAVAVELDPKHISKILFSDTGHNTIFDVEVAGKPSA